MNLHPVVLNMIAAQNSFDTQAYAACFTERAIVHDEGRTHIGRAAIGEWIGHSNEEYQAVMKPVGYEREAGGHLLTAEVSGTFPGSPAVLKFYLELEDELISSLRITG